MSAAFPFREDSRAGRWPESLDEATKALAAGTEG